jgi:hypothetical protein
LEFHYESKETFTVPRTVPEAITALKENLRNAGYKPRATADSVTAATGSNLVVRLWGTSLPWGRKNVPVAMTVSLTSTPTGSVAQVHAHDQLGFFFDAKTNPVLKEEAPRKIATLIEVARQALQ